MNSKGLFENLEIGLILQESMFYSALGLILFKNNKYLKSMMDTNEILSTINNEEPIIVVRVYLRAPRVSALEARVNL